MHDGALHNVFMYWQKWAQYNHFFLQGMIWNIELQKIMLS